MDRWEKDREMIKAAHTLKGLCADRLACHAGTLEPTDCPLNGDCGMPMDIQYWTPPDIEEEGEAHD